MKIWNILFCLLFIAANCGGPQEPNPPPPPPPVPTVDPVPMEPTCSTACENQRELGCELGSPTAEGASCEEVCLNSEASPLVGMAWDVKTLTMAEDCK